MKDNQLYEIKDDKFILHDYNNAKPFASFFPSIAGLWGKPMWVFFVNRGQAIACMGTNDKNGAMMEFVGANKAYRYASLHGFRTFLKIKNKNKVILYEPFKNQGSKSINIEQSMEITSYSLKLKEVNMHLGLEVSVEYFTLANEKIPGLIRILTIKNISRKTLICNCVDGLPMIIPYGTSNDLLKNMSVIGESWFDGVEFIGKNKIPVYKLQVEPVDRPEVVRVNGANFYMGFLQDPMQKKLSPEYITDPYTIFGQMNDFTMPMKFYNNGRTSESYDISAKNKTPSAMGRFPVELNSKKSFSYSSIVGYTADIDRISTFTKIFTSSDYIEKKRIENQFIIKSIQSKVLMKSSSNYFDNYSQQTFLDNLLRGGYPVVLGTGKNKKVYYAFSRIHGDMEREYNDFVITPQYFSHGNGNYRDVNQNRRNDIFFNPDVKEESLVYFINLIQLDGFNPLGVIGSKFQVVDKDSLLSVFKSSHDKNKIDTFIEKPFNIGEFFNFIDLDEIKISLRMPELLNLLMKTCDKIDYAHPKTGYWSDHWHYNISLIESYLGVYPEKLEEILIKKKMFTYYDNPYLVMPREEKYVLFQNKPRQLNAVYYSEEKEAFINRRKLYKNIVRTEYGKGKIYKTTLLAKLLGLVANKYASLDPFGCGIELESERSNWNDALNGLPGLFGSSTAESIELKRLILFILDKLKKMNLKYEKGVFIAKEIYNLLIDLDKITKKEKRSFSFWNKSHTVKEKFWKKVQNGIDGEKVLLCFNTIEKILIRFLEKVEDGINRSFDKKTGVINTYFENEVVQYKMIKGKSGNRKNWGDHHCIQALKFKQKQLPLFLEGPVHLLRINKDQKKAIQYYRKVQKSGLYDRKLKMYKVNASLKEASIDIGRLKIFTPGWLENESVWLHMEYKYLLELLRSGLVDEFYHSAKSALVPFMDPKVYGRSLFENVSFIASSAHPDKKLHGQGFIARLSGSTAEFLSMWVLMTTGLKPFFMEEDQLCLQFQPKLSAHLFTKKREQITYYNDMGVKPISVNQLNRSTEQLDIEKNSFLFKFLGRVLVVYHNPKRKNTYAKNGVKIHKYELNYHNGHHEMIKEDILREPFSYDVRHGKVKRIDIWMK